MTNDEIAKLTVREHHLTIGPARPAANSPARRRPNPGNSVPTGSAPEFRSRPPGLGRGPIIRPIGRWFGPPGPVTDLIRSGTIPTIPPRAAQSGREKSLLEKIFGKI
jgi:hypothetical protein